VKQHFDNLRGLLSQVAVARQNYKAKLATIEAQKETFAPEYIGRLRAEATANMQSFNQASYEKACELVQALTKAAVEKHNQWPNLSDPKLSNALKIIELSGGKLDGDAVRKINEQFTGDTPSLRALQQIYKAQGVVYDGGIDKQLYDPESAGESLSQFAYHVFYQDGSLNTFGTAIGKIAACEGIQFDGMIDQAGVDAVTRAAAGLPAK
jgi:hypothetical protein